MLRVFGRGVENLLINAGDTVVSFRTAAGGTLRITLLTSAAI